MNPIPQTRRTTWQLLTKVPKVTVYFWVLKLLTTAMGESTSDYMVHVFNPYLAVGIGIIILMATLAFQFRARTYIPGIYWLAALGVSISGTMGADVVHVAFGVPYVVSGVGYAIILALVFAVWRKSEGTLSIHSIYTRKRELFYWAAILATFALGTAVGDLAAYTLHLGYLVSAVVFSVAFVIPGLCYWRWQTNPVLTFWCAYILTRPLGASIADWTAKASSIGGLGYGDGPVSLVLGVLLVLCVTYVTIVHADKQSKA